MLLLVPSQLQMIWSLLVPSVRQAVFQWLKSKVKVQSFTMGEPPQSARPNPHGDRVIDGEFEDVTPRKPRDGQPSEWTRH